MEDGVEGWYGVKVGSFFQYEYIFLGDRKNDFGSVMVGKCLYYQGVSLEFRDQIVRLVIFLVLLELGQNKYLVELVVFVSIQY